MELDYICSVFGHNDLFDDENWLRARLERVFLDLIVMHNVKTFLFGGFSRFDFLCYEVVSKLKEQFGFIERVYCVENERLMRPNKRPMWMSEKTYEKIIYLEPDFKYWYTQIYYRNVEMIKASDYVVVYIRKTERSGAYKTYEYAKKAKKKIIEI